MQSLIVQSQEKPPPEARRTDLSSQTETRTAGNAATAYRLVFAGLAFLCAAVVLIIAAIATHPGIPKTTNTDTTSLEAPTIARFQQATGQHQRDTAVPVDITFQRGQDPYELQRTLEDRGWYFYSHWGKEAAALPQSDLPVLEAARVSPEEAITVAGNLPKAPAEAAMINAALTLKPEDPVHRSPLFIAAMLAVGAWAILLPAAPVKLALTY